MAPFQLLSIRAEDEAAEDEYRSVARFGGLDEDALRGIRLTREPLGHIDLGDWSGIILGGGPFNVSDPAESKSDVQVRAEAELLDLVARVVDADFPFLGCCYGVGTLGTVIGATIDRNHSEPVGAVSVTLTPDGHADPLFAGLGPLAEESAPPAAPPPPPAAPVAKPVETPVAPVAKPAEPVKPAVRESPAAAMPTPLVDTSLVASPHVVSTAAVLASPAPSPTAATAASTCASASRAAAALSARLAPRCIALNRANSPRFIRSRLAFSSIGTGARSASITGRSSSGTGPSR